MNWRKNMKIKDQLKTIDKITDKAIKYIEKDRVGKRMQTSI